MALIVCGVSHAVLTTRLSLFSQRLHISIIGSGLQRTRAQPERSGSPYTFLKLATEVLQRSLAVPQCLVSFNARHLTRAMQRAKYYTIIVIHTRCMAHGLPCVARHSHMSGVPTECATCVITSWFKLWGIMGSATTFTTTDSYAALCKRHRRGRT